MRVFKKTYRNKDGKQEAGNYTIEFKNHDDTVQRVPGTSDKASSEAAGKNIMLLVGYKYGGLSLASDIELSR